MKKGFYCDKDGEILLITENESNNSGVKSNNSQCIDCINNDICQFYKALGATVICYPCGFYEAKSNEELFKQALVEGVNRHIDKTIEEAKKIGQIEEMAQFLAVISHLECGKKPCEECKWLGRGNDKADCTDYLIAEHLYNAGYRKQNVGEWIRIGQDSSKCSLCGKEHNGGMTIAYFCPHCGVRMRGGEKQ